MSIIGPALNGIIEQTSNQALKKVIAQLKDSVNEGNSFTTALSDHPRLFSLCPSLKAS